MLLSLLVLACKKDPDGTTEAPVISIDPTSPLPGAFVDDGDLRVVGSTTGLSEVTVNGKPASSVAGQFDATIDAPRGMVPIEITGQDANGNHWTERYTVLAGEFEPAEGKIDDALVLRLNQAGLDDVADLLSELVVADDLLADLSTGAPVYNVYFESVWPLDDTDVDIYLTDLSFQPLRVHADPSPGDLHLDVRLPSLYVELQTFGTIPLLSNTNGDRIVMSAQEVHIEADVRMDVASDGSVRTSLVNPTVQMPGFDITWEYLWAGVDWVLDLFLDLQTLVEDALVGALDSTVPDLLTGVFDALNTSFDLDLLGKSVGIRLQLSSIEADADGVQLQADLSVNAPSALVREEGGWLRAPSAKLAEPSHTTPVSVAISDDFLNRALYEMWAANLISLTLSTEDGSLDPLMLGALGATQGSISVMAGLPPVAVEQDGRFVAELGEVALHLETPGGERGDFLDVVLGGQARLDLTIEDDELRLAIGSPDLRFQVQDSDWGASNDTITALLEEELPIDVLLLLLGNVAFPLPEIPYISIDHATAERDPSGVHTDIDLFFR